MQIFGIPALIDPNRNTRDRLLVGIMAVVLAITVFYVDTFTEIESAIAVLYVIVLLLMGEIATRLGIAITAIGCGILTFVSYFDTHGTIYDLAVTLRLVVAIAALVITAILLLRS